MTIARGCNKRSYHIAVAIGEATSRSEITEGNHFIALDVLMSAESEIIAAFLRCCFRPITVDYADVEVLLLVKLGHRAGKNSIKAPMAFKSSQGPIDSCVVYFWSPILVLLDGQLFPLTPKVQKFQNVVKDHV